FAVVWLRDEKIVHVYAKLARIGWIERVFRVDEGRLAAELLRFGDDLQRERRLTAGFRAVDFDHAAARKAADAERSVNGKTASGNRADRHQDVLAAEPHDAALAVRLFDLRYRRFQELRSFVCHVTPRWRKIGKMR